MTLLESAPMYSVNQNLFLRIRANNDIYKMEYTTDNKKWSVLKEVDAKLLSTKTAGGFVGSVFGLYVTSLGEATKSKAFFDWFDYKGNDDVFK